MSEESTARKMNGDGRTSSRETIPPNKGKIPRQHMPTQPAPIRVSNFQEVNLGLDAVVAQLEASRCLLCKRPSCREGCPVAIDIPAFIGALAAGDTPAAVEIVRDSNALPCVTGRVCPQESQCEKECILAKKGESVAIGHLERYVSDWAERTMCEAPLHIPPSGKRVAVVGSGPGGLACAGDLVRKGHHVTVFEALHAAGGVLRYGIPEFRLPKAILDYELQRLERLGVEIVCNVIISTTFTLEELTGRLGFDAVYLACGAGFPNFLGIPGENLKGVYSANEFLTRINLMGATRGGKSATPVLTAANVVVVGGGNTALDAVRSARRMGAHTATLAYRRSFEEMPARAEEIKHAQEEGIRFELLANPTEAIGDKDGWLTGLRCMRNGLSEPDASGRRRPVPIAGSEFEIPCGVLIEAIGTSANPLLRRNTSQLKLNSSGYIQTDEQGMTNMPGVFAGGDIVRGAATVILAMGDGKHGAEKIHHYLSSLPRK